MSDRLFSKILWKVCNAIRLECCWNCLIILVDKLWFGACHSIILSLSALTIRRHMFLNCAEGFTSEAPMLALQSVRLVRWVQVGVDLAEPGRWLQFTVANNFDQGGALPERHTFGVWCFGGCTRRCPPQKLFEVVLGGVCWGTLRRPRTFELFLAAYLRAHLKRLGWGSTSLIDLLLASSSDLTVFNATVTTVTLRSYILREYEEVSVFVWVIGWPWKTFG